jgi:8-oxo-dGTP diphosphatase
MLEMWDLYNDKREKTGKVLIRCLPVPKGLYHLTVSAWIVNSQGQYLLSQRHPQKTYPLCWECTGGSVLAGEDSLNGAMREVREELGIMLNPFKAEMIYHTRREMVQDFYDVWLFHADIDISEIKVQETEVVGVQWVNREVLFDMLHSGKLHPLIDYIEEIF